MEKLNIKKLEVNIEDIAKYDLDNNNIQGCSYYVYQEGNVELRKYFGTADLTEDKKIDEGTIFRIASMTKPITAVAVMILIERGLLSLDDPVSKFLPGFKNIHVITPDGEDMGEVKNEVKILHLLTHTSGFGGMKPVNMKPDDRKSTNNTIEYYFKAGLDFEPFSNNAYSGVGAFEVIAAVIEKVCGMSYGEFLKKEVLIPCGMKDTVFAPTKEQWDRVVMMHDRVDDKNSIVKMEDGCIFGTYPCEHSVAGAGLASTLDDYANFARMLLGRGKTESGYSVISDEAVKIMSYAHVPEEIMSGNERWGLGVRVITSEEYGTLPVGSFGWSGAYGSHFWVDPKNKICAVFMKNSNYDGGAANRSAQRFEKAVYDALI